VCFFRRVVESNREFVAHDVNQEPYASFAVLATPSRARVPIARLHTTSWALECPRQGIARKRNILFPFCDITSISNLQVSEFDFEKSRVCEEDLAQSSWDTKFGKVWQDGIE
jgi:hypothetical protein